MPSIGTLKRKEANFYRRRRTVLNGTATVHGDGHHERRLYHPAWPSIFTVHQERARETNTQRLYFVSGRHGVTCSLKTATRQFHRTKNKKKVKLFPTQQKTAHGISNFNFKNLVSHTSPVNQYHSNIVFDGISVCCVVSPYD